MSRPVVIRGLAVIIGLAFVAAKIYRVVASFGGEATSTPLGVVDILLWGSLSIVFPVLGSLIITKQPRNAIGWLMIVPLFAFAAGGVTDLEQAPANPSLWFTLAVWFDNWSWLLMILPICIIFALFPNGRPVTPRWRWLTRTAIAMAASLVTIITLGKTLEPSSGNYRIDNPVGFVPELLDRIWPLLDLGLLVLTIGVVASMVVRYRRADAMDRAQLKWLVYAGAIFAPVFISFFFFQGFSESVGGDLILGLALMGIPVAITVAILRYRVYDIDLVINRTVLFVLLAGFITAVYAVVVVGIGALIGSQRSLGLSIAATAVVAFAFEPVRSRVQRWANRIAYGDRATPYEVLSDLTQRLASAESAQGLLDRTAERLADGTGAERARVWVVEGDAYRLAGRWPDQPSPISVVARSEIPGFVTEIESDGERLGALSLEKRRGDPITPTELRLIEDLAGSAGSLLRNVTLQAALHNRAEELAASRRRLVDVQDNERRRLEQELDQGAQQLVVSLKVKLDVAARLARKEGSDQLAQLLEGMGTDAREAIKQIRSFARGLYPPLLQAEGLVVAVRSIADIAPVSVEVEADGVGRLSAELEATVFFCISEAITNGAKHAGGSPILVRLFESDGVLSFEVRDQGPGFDLSTAKLGSGLRNMADRLDGVGGRLEVVSAPGQGTSIRGTVPLPEHELVVSGVG